jgi:hypothetical protein
MITIESTIYNNYPLYIFVCDSNITEEDVIKYSIYIESIILSKNPYFYLGYFISNIEESSSILMIAKCRSYIKKISLLLKGRCLASFIHTEDNTIKKIIRIMESLTTSYNPSKLVNTVDEGYSFLSQHISHNIAIN